MSRLDTELDAAPGPISVARPPEAGVRDEAAGIRRVDPDQIRLAFGYEWAPLATAVISGALALVVYGNVSTPGLAIWLALSLLTAFAWDRLFRSFRRNPISQAQVVRWSRLLTIRAATNGFLWGFAAVAITDSEPVILHAFIAFVIAGMTAGALMVSASFLPAFAAFALPANLLLAAAYVIAGDVPHFVMAAMVVFFLVLSLGIAARWNSSIRASLSLQRELVVSRQRFQDFAEAASDWYYEFDAAYENAAVQRDDQSDQAIFFRQLVKDLRSRIAADGDGDLGEIFTQVAARNAFRDLIYTYADARGRQKWVRISGKPIYDGDGNYLGYRGVVSDITEQKKAEEILDGERTMLENLASDTSLPAVLTGIAHWIEEAISGSRCSILLVDQETTLRPGAAPTFGEDFLRSIDGVRISSSKFPCAVAVSRKELVVTRDVSGDALWEDFRGTASEHGLRSCWAMPVFARANNVVGTFAVCSFDPSLPEESDLRIMRVASNLVGIAIERHRVEESQRRANRLESMGQLTAGVAHEFNNLLQAIVSGLNLLVEESPDAPKSRSRVEAIHRSATHGRELIRSLLSFVGASRSKTDIVAVDRVLKESIDLLKPALGDAIEFRLEVAPGLWPIRCNRGELEAALMNLAINARDALPKGGAIEFEARNITFENEHVLWNGEIADPGEYVQISITDNGSGMDRNTLDRIFDPFFTTKDVGKGTGLGMSMVYGFIRHHASGYIQIETEPDRGTCITLYIPRTTSPAIQEGNRNPDTPVDVPDDLSLLVVEDNDIVRSALTTMLERVGFTIHQAATGGEALAQLEGGLAVDLMLTDIVLAGGMSGTELSESARTLNPSLKTLFMTGHSKDELVRGRFPGNEAMLLQKPFQVEELKLKIAEIMQVEECSSRVPSANTSGPAASFSPAK